MKLSEVKDQLSTMKELRFQLPDGSFVPQHFHVTEIGVVTKYFIDCGGTVRTEKVANFQLWQADDFDHRLAPQKLRDIIQLSEEILKLEDLEVEVEYQQETIGKYGLTLSEQSFVLQNLQTDCLAKDKCGIPPKKKTLPLSTLQPNTSTSCAPGSGCC